MKNIWLFFTLAAGLASAQTTVLLPWTPTQFFDSTGRILPGGKVCTYQAGTSTGLATFTDSTGVTSNPVPPNAIVLNSAGQANIWLTSTRAYKIVLMTAGSDSTCSTGTVLRTVDQVSGLASGSPIVASKIDGVFYMDGVVYPCTTAGVQAILAAVAAAGGGTADARFCQTLTITSQINIGDGTHSVTLLLPAGGVWTAGTITDGTSCLFQQNSNSRIKSDGGIINGFILHAGAGTNSLGAVYCTTSAGGSYLNMEFVQVYNPNGAAVANGTMFVRTGADNSLWDSVVVAAYGVVGLNITNACCDATFRNLTINGNFVAGGVPLVITGSSQVLFSNSSIDHPGAGQPNIKIVGPNSVTNFAGFLYMESSSTDTTTPLIQITDAGGGSTFVAQTIFSSPQVAAHTAYVIQNTGTSEIAVQSLQRRGNSSGTNGINEVGKGFTVRTDPSGNLSYNSHAFNYSSGQFFVGTPFTSPGTQFGITYNGLSINGLTLQDTEASGKTIAIGPGIVVPGRTSIVDNTDGPNTELFSCNNNTSSQCATKAFQIGSLSANSGLTAGAVAIVGSSNPSGIAGDAVCNADATNAFLKCNFNNTTTVPLAVTQAYNPIAGTYRVTADQTIAAGASLQNIPGLSWTLPANLALNISYACNLVWVQNTAAAADSFGFQDVTNAPTNVFTYASADNVSGSKAGVTGITDGAPGTAATTMINVTPGAAATFYGAYFTGTIEQPSNASTSAFNIMAQFTTNSGVIKRGSFCQVF